MNLSDQFSDFIGPTQLPGLSKGKKRMKKTASPLAPPFAKKKGKGKKAAATKPQWAQISDKMAKDC